MGLFAAQSLHGKCLSSSVTSAGFIQGRYLTLILGEWAADFLALFKILAGDTFYFRCGGEPYWGFGPKVWGFMPAETQVVAQGGLSQSLRSPTMPRPSLAFLALLIASGCTDSRKQDAPSSPPSAPSSSRIVPLQPSSHATCAKLCPINGRCKARGEACYAVSEADCLRSAGCTMLGTCSLVGESCAAARPEDCRASAMCKSAGKCALLDGACGKGE